MIDFSSRNRFSGEFRTCVGCCRGFYGPVLLTAQPPYQYELNLYYFSVFTLPDFSEGAIFWIYCRDVRRDGRIS